jgi:hypothetical protein
VQILKIPNSKLKSWGLEFFLFLLQPFLFFCSYHKKKYINQNFSIMKKLLFLSTLLLCSLLHVSCNPDDVTNNPTTTNPVDVYVAGSKNNQACYWKNGQIVMLDSGGITKTSAYKLIVSNGDVYIFGGGYNLQSANEPKSLFWKNGVLSNLNIQFNSSFLSINDFDVVGNDVYISGFSSNNQTNGYVFGYWKNGNRIILNDNTIDHNPSYIKVVNNNVYIAVRFPQPGYYINSNFYQIPNSGISGISANNDQIYIYGRKLLDGFFYNVSTNISTNVSFINDGNIANMCFENNNIYYSNNREIYKNSSLFGTALSSYFITDFKIKNENLYRIVFGPNANSIRVEINNVVTLTSEIDENFKSLFIVQN